MARPRTFLSDYPKMGIGFPYLRTFDNGSSDHGIIYAHSAEDARRRLTEGCDVATLVLLDGKVKR